MRFLIERAKHFFLGYLPFMIILAIIAFIIFNIFQKNDSSNKTKIGKIESGANVIFNTNQADALKQGVYLRGSSTFVGFRGEVGVFKEVTKHIELELGGGVQHDSNKDEGFIQLGTRFKF